MKAVIVILILAIAAELQFSTVEARSLEYEGISLANFTRLETTKSAGSRKAGNVHYASNFVSSWNGAMQYCNQISGKLESITTEIENESIRQKLISEGLLRNSYWTSGILDKESSTFAWAGNGQRFLYTNWKSGEPVARCGNIDICVHVRAEGYTNNLFSWYTENCNSSFYFICAQ